MYCGWKRFGKLRSHRNIRTWFWVVGWLVISTREQFFMYQLYCVIITLAIGSIFIKLPSNSSSIIKCSAIMIYLVSSPINYILNVRFKLSSPLVIHFGLFYAERFLIILSWTFGLRKLPREQHTSSQINNFWLLLSWLSFERLGMEKFMGSNAKRAWPVKRVSFGASLIY